MIGFDCLKYHTLPHDGGLHDQPLLLFHRMKIALNTFENIRAFREAQMMDAKSFSKWQALNPKIVKFMQYVWKLQGVFDE